MRQVTQCPVCEAPLRITELSCTACDTKLHGTFPPSPLARLGPEHQRFIETFVLCRGIIRDVERALGISYPTVRARLDAAVAALKDCQAEAARASAASALSSGAAASEPPRAVDAALAERRREVLRQVETGLLDAGEAAEALRRLSEFVV